MEEKGIIINSSYKDSITLIPKLGKGIIRKESYELIFFININAIKDLKILNKIYENLIKQCIKINK